MGQKTMKFKLKAIKAVIFYEIFGFGLLLIFLWLDELLDIPHYVFGSIKTPVNIVESIFESIMILFICIFCIRVTIGLLAEIKVLEGLLPICASCKKIRDSDNTWQHFETYIERRANVSFSHGLCHECKEKLYGDQEWYKNIS